MMSQTTTPDTPSGYSAAEMGYPGPQPPTPGDLPPGGGRLAVPTFLSFAGLVQTAARTFRWTYDEALRDNRNNALAMRRDAVLMGALRARQRPTSQLSWHLTPRDETDPAESEAAQLMTELIEDIPKFQKMKMQLLEALWYGRYAVELTWEWQERYGRQVLQVRDFIPINGDKIRFKWDGTPGFLVYANYPGTREATDWGMAHFVTPDERQQYIIHEHEPDDADWTEGEMAGSVHGVGIRGRLYWFWWLKQQVFALLMNYLERFSNGLTIIYYAAHDPEAKKSAEAMARAEYVNNTLLIPRWNTENPDMNKVERLEVSTASPALLQQLITDYFDEVPVRYILGQTLSGDHTGSGGLGGTGAAGLAGETLDEIIKYDAIDLQDTLQTDLVNVMYRYNAPGVRPGKFEFEIDSPNSAELMEYGNMLLDWGMSLDEEQAYKVSQWARPKPGGGIVSKIGAMNPAAVTSAPQGVPVAGSVGQNGAMPGANGMPVQTGQAQYRRPTSQSRKALPRRRLVPA
jgi:phage gp29-like protein